MSHYIGETAAAVVSTEPVGCFAPLSLRSTSLLRGVRTTYPNPEIQVLDGLKPVLGMSRTGLGSLSHSRLRGVNAPV